MKSFVQCLTLTLAIVVLASSATAYELVNQTAAAHDPTGNAYLVARQSDSAGIECFRATAGGVRTGSTITLSSQLAYHPDVAYDSVLGRFLVIWSEVAFSSGPDEWSIKGRFITTAGAISGDEFVVADSLTDKPGARLAYSAHTGRYFVAFRTQTAVRGRFVAGDGTPDGNAFDVMSGESHPDFNYTLSAAVECDTVNHRFLVIGIVYASGIPPLFLYGALVDDASPVSIHKAAFPVYISTTYLYPPNLAFDPVSERFLVAWEYYTGGGHELWGQMIDADGSLSGSNWKIVSNRTVAFANDVIYKPVDGRYLVAWLDERGGGGLSIYGQEVSADGANHGSEFQLSATGYQFDLALTHNPVSENTLLSYGGHQQSHLLVTPALPEADLAVAIAAPDQALAGGSLIYTVTATNHGGDDAPGATLTFTLPGSATFVSATPSQGACEHAGGTVTCDLGTLANGASATVTVEVVLMTTGDATATAAVTSDALDSNGANDSAGAGTTVRGAFAVSPGRGTTGTEIEITGANFGTKKGKVKLVGPNGSKSLKILSWNEGGNGVIRAVVKKTPVAGTYSLLVKPKGAAEVVETDAFEIVAPKITQCPGGASVGATVTISGTCFGTKAKKVYVEYQKGEKTKRKSVKVIDWPEDAATGTGTGDITFKLPKKLPTGQWKLVVATKAGEHDIPFIVADDG